MAMLCYGAFFFLTLYTTCYDQNLYLQIILSSKQQREMKP